jgi:hypothetical protein
MQDKKWVIPREDRDTPGLKPFGKKTDAERFAKYTRREKNQGLSLA